MRSTYSASVVGSSSLYVETNEEIPSRVSRLSMSDSSPSLRTLPNCVQNVR
ncbi:Uncharacterised protein [Mycobacterium tuberculosis]|uniref:Uncharacterized protein n=1 Tax=Mycobacterium tuberculosis TaxID=1773 RepID=A0A655E2S8_MYCTX|nr:Uncharacterised protein [Mycobacterium tuberculosis]CFS28437.1 Uncharacterised protein [Mycobacterium tuberculosis]CNU98348.1 Uncharacterised protein [Mycobacterium tuberculosis]COW37223.1 Uncharacterised protein [Mycobacterium tuberculosis]COW89083.1 Uncharacterised protein [Mycobacterium tuberculosis]